MRYRRKSETVEVVTFAEFIQYRRGNAIDLSDSILTSFSYRGHPVTHTDEGDFIFYAAYPDDGAFSFTPDDVLVIGEGEICSCRSDLFALIYEPVAANTPVSEKKLTSLSFGMALEALKYGKKVYRAGWNGKGMFLFLVPGSTFAVNRPPLLGIYPEGWLINYRPHIDMKTVDDEIVPWGASQSDVLAEDWETV